jgi:hypothetical protein
MPCTSPNCCGIDTKPATGCATPPVTLPELPGCAGTNRTYFCSQIRLSYGAFTACCPPGQPYSCPNGTPFSCYETAAAARAACGDFCSACAP